jgi:uncharacterized membrane protein YhaH (DUF805 family)
MANGIISLGEKLFRGTVSRAQYAFLGCLLVLVKTLLDWGIARLVFHKPWNSPWMAAQHYYFLGDTYNSVESLILQTGELAFHLTLLVFALPFMLVGLSLTAKRLNALKTHPWMLVLFFIPFVQLLFFGVLAALPPDRALRGDEDRRRQGDWLSPYLPRNPYLAAIAAGGLTAAFGVISVFYSTHLLGIYGGFLFVGLPFCLGFLSDLLYSPAHEATVGEEIGVAMGGLAVVAVLLLVFSIEGLVCLAMAAPLAIPLVIGGVLCAHAIKQPLNREKGKVVVSILLFLPGLMGLESATHLKPREWAVSSSVVIKASPEKVWNTVIAFPEISAPLEPLFKIGISYPTLAVIEGHGVGALRKCRFNTGDFLEPITKWQEPQVLAFDVVSQPQPMTELSFYKHVHAPHLEGYFVSHRGQFRLTRLPDGSTLLEGTTWYTHAIQPEAYWHYWSDLIIHSIHLRVLEHVKRITEAM